MSDKSFRSPPPRQHGRPASTGNFKAQGSPKTETSTSADSTKADSTSGPSKADEGKRDAVKVPAVTQQRTRSGAMRATTRPDNPLAVFKAHDEQPRRAKPDPAPPAVEAPAPPAPRAPPRVPPPAPRTPSPTRVSSRSLAPMTPPALPQTRAS